MKNFTEVMNIDYNKSKKKSDPFYLYYVDSYFFEFLLYLRYL